jgi:hypothetical protein
MLIKTYSLYESEQMVDLNHTQLSTNTHIIVNKFSKQIIDMKQNNLRESSTHSCEQIIKTN